MIKVNDRIFKGMTKLMKCLIQKNDLKHEVK